MNGRGSDFAARRALERDATLRMCIKSKCWIALFASPKQS